MTVAEQPAATRCREDRRLARARRLTPAVVQTISVKHSGHRCRQAGRVQGNAELPARVAGVGLVLGGGYGLACARAAAAGGIHGWRVMAARSAVSALMPCLTAVEM